MQWDGKCICPRFDVHICSFIFHGFVFQNSISLHFSIFLAHPFLPSNCSQISVRTIDVVNEVRVILCATTWPKSWIKSTSFITGTFSVKAARFNSTSTKKTAHFQMDPNGLPYCSCMFGTIQTASMSPVASLSQPQIPVMLHSAAVRPLKSFTSSCTCQCCFSISNPKLG